MQFTREQSDKIQREAQAATGRKINVDGHPTEGLTLRDADSNKVVGSVKPGAAAELGSVKFVKDVEVDASKKPADHPYQGFPTTNLTAQVASPGQPDVNEQAGKPGDLTTDATLNDVYDAATKKEQDANPGVATTSSLSEDEQAAAQPEAPASDAPKDK